MFSNCCNCLLATFLSSAVDAFGNPMGTNCAPLFCDLLLHTSEAYFVADLILKKEH